MTPKTRNWIIGAAGLGLFFFAGAFITQRALPVNMPSPFAPRAANTTPAEIRLPGITQWFNTQNGQPITAADMRGKVVLVDFWTYSCINCIRTLPYITDWQKKYADKGLLIIGIHTPEFAFEKVPANVANALTKYDITYPVGLDNDFATWNAFDNHYWPAKYLFDSSGTLVYTHFGEGEYNVTEKKIQELLADTSDMPLTQVSGGPDFRSIGTPETYLGYSRAEAYAHPITPDENSVYLPTPPEKNKVVLEGMWRVEDERVVSTGAGGKMRMQFSASAVHLVMGTPNGLATVEVLLNGQPVPPEARPADMREENGRTILDVRDKDLYTLIDRHGAYAAGLLELRWDGPVECYAFTFG